MVYRLVPTYLLDSQEQSKNALAGVLPDFLLLLVFCLLRFWVSKNVKRFDPKGIAASLESTYPLLGSIP